MRGNVGVLEQVQKDFPLGLFCGAHCFVFPSRAKASSHEHGTLTPPPACMVSLPPLVLKIHQEGCTPCVHLIRRATQLVLIGIVTDG